MASQMMATNTIQMGVAPKSMIIHQMTTNLDMVILLPAAGSAGFQRLTAISIWSKLMKSTFAIHLICMDYSSSLVKINLSDVWS